MAKLSRSALKGIVKECLVEILSEGLSGNALDLNEGYSRKPQASRRKTRTRNDHGNRAPVDTVSFNSAVDNTVKKVTNDPVMAALLADTATTTLQEQYAAGEPGASVSEEGVALESQGADIFGEASQNWAQLAFSDGKS